MDISNSQLLLLLNWLSPAFPIGAYAYSHGLEWAIEAGEVSSAADVKAWISDVITRGSGWNDAVMFVQSWSDDVNDLALALCSSQERYLETTQLGAAFEKAAAVFLGAPSCSRPLPLVGRVRVGVAQTYAIEDFSCSHFETGATPTPALPTGGREKGDVAYPIAAAAACRAFGVDRDHALLAYLQGFSNALISVAVRLVPIGQTAGLEIMRDLMPVISATAARASQASLEDLGSCTLLADIAAMKHETQHSRIFRT